MHSLYDIALYPMRAVAAIWAAYASRDPASALEWQERRGRRLPEAPPGAIWLHGASLGEARLVTALAHSLQTARPDISIVASAMTPAGRAALPDIAVARFLLPIDVAVWQARLLQTLRPSALVLFETEMWPNLVREAERLAVPVCLVNARLAPERMERYRMFRRLYEPLLRRIARIGAQDEAEAARFGELGVSRRSIVVTGNIKYDLPPPTVSRDGMRAELGLPPNRPVLIAGSTGEGEDALVLDGFDRVRAHHRDALLVLAPRHASRFDDAERLALARGHKVRRISRDGAAVPAGADVLLVDMMGRLAALYAAADVAFVGGSLVPVGGHNVLEPAACGVPVLFGPHTDHVIEPAKALERAGGALRVADATALGDAWTELLADPERRQAIAVAAANVVAMNRGALAKSTALVLEAMPKAAAPAGAR